MDTTISSLTVSALPGIPLVQQGDDLPRIILDGIAKLGFRLETGDALVVTSKIVSKSEGRLFDLRDIEPGAEAQRLAAETRKDPRIVELVLRESLKISRQAPGVLVVQH